MTSFFTGNKARLLIMKNDSFVLSLLNGRSDTFKGAVGRIVKTQDLPKEFEHRQLLSPSPPFC